MIQWVSADSEEDRENGVRFLCRNGEKLGVPYKWSTVMSSLSCSLNENGFMIALDDYGQVGGALAYTYGTGEDDYENRSRIEVHLLYIDKPFRGEKALVETIQALSSHVLALPQRIGEIGFYCVPAKGNRRLYGKCATIRNTKLHPCGILDFYTAAPESLRQYAVSRMAREKTERE
ncbi:hypothetical protein FE783_04930 [Paenibacillus mesophilus]|uniref:hypothetical protein n=1 Tax=Paenibacillus mesophilus TaxID=2582849 RepID=UPI00110DDA01|nr:hypothetical protein [Paenibacillus mesophilus]TMV52288.1 hypothetical protein FE783_04930 [Paenibacillus mesophilus]